MDLKKYKWKNRLLLIETPNYQNENYKNSKDIYQKNIKEFHKRYVKFITRLNKDKIFKVHLIGFDGKVKNSSNLIQPNKLFKLIDQMPMSKNNFKPTNLSLYSDYDKSNTVPNLGFKDKDKAIYTINAIKNKDTKYQVNVISTMLGRAKNHPNQTENMRDAIKIFNKWLDEYHKNK